MLLYGNAKTPWTEGNLKYYVSHLDAEGKHKDWLYDSFLFLNVKASSGNDYCADINLGTSMSGEGDFFAMVSPHPANKNDWDELLEFYLGHHGAIRNLDSSIAKARQHIAEPYGTKRNVVLMLPYPHPTQEHFGEILGGLGDFSVANQSLMEASKERLTAEKWFVDEIVKRFNDQSFEHVHLLGVYWMFETVFRSWNVDDHWLLKELRPHIHQHGLKFLWIPFWSSYNIHLLEDYQNYYFDLAFLQPNFMFYERIRGVGDAARRARQCSAGIEMEYYLELNEPIKIHDERHSRFRDYLNGGVTFGYMNNAACAHFQGVGSLQRMHSHVDPQEQEFYDDIYHFVKGDYKLKPELPRRTKRECREHALAIDLGGTNLRVAIIDECGNILKRESVPTPPSKDFVIKEMIALASKMKSLSEQLGSTLQGIGISTGGRVDYENGIINDSTALLAEWQNLPLGALLESELHLSVSIDNDGNCAAIAEQFFGQGRSCSNFVSLVLGTGIGGGVVVNDLLLRGANNAAAELGHISIDMNGPLCSCGNRGCVELYASGSGIARLAKELLESGTIRIDGLSPEAATAEKLGEAARKGNKVSQQLIQQAGKSLGIALSGLINTFNPEKIILSGNLLQLGEWYLDPMREAVRQHAMKTARESVEIVVSDLNDAALVGAAGLVFKS